MKLYSVYDKQAMLFTQPFVAESNAMAKRMFLSGIASGKNPTMTDFADEYSLMFLGTFDEVKGQFYSVENPLEVASGSEALKILDSDSNLS